MENDERRPLPDRSNIDRRAADGNSGLGDAIRGAGGFDRSEREEAGDEKRDRYAISAVPPAIVHAAPIVRRERRPEPPPSPQNQKSDLTPIMAPILPAEETGTSPEPDLETLSRPEIDARWLSESDRRCDEALDRIGKVDSMGKGKAFSPDTEARLEAQAHSAIEESIRRRMARSFRSLKGDAAGSLAQLLSSKRASGHFTEGLKSSRDRLLAPRERPHQYLQTPLDGEGTLVPADEYRFYGPPYELDNTNSWRFGQPGLTQYADKSTGYTTLAQRVIDHTGGGWGWAGVGFWYVPRTRAGLLEFRARIRVTYEYQLQSAVETAHSRGEVGIIVFSWNMQGQDFRQEPAASNLLWEDGTSWTEDHDFSNDLYSSGLRLDVALDSARRYSCFAYIFASIDASGTDGLSGSVASTDIWAWYPYLVTEEKGIKL